MGRINDKIIEIEKFLEELEDIIPGNFEEYKKDFQKKAACERYFEKIIEAVVDLGFILIRENDFKLPEDDEGVFEILLSKGIISERLSSKLRDAKGMRNIIAHEYGNIDDELIFETISNELKKDVEDFIDNIEKFK